MTTFYLDASVALRAILGHSPSAAAWIDAITASDEDRLVSSRVLRTELTRVLGARGFRSRDGTLARRALPGSDLGWSPGRGRGDRAPRQDARRDPPRLGDRNRDRRHHRHPRLRDARCGGTSSATPRSTPSPRPTDLLERRRHRVAVVVEHDARARRRDRRLRRQVLHDELAQLRRIADGDVHEVVVGPAEERTPAAQAVARGSRPRTGSMLAWRDPGRRVTPIIAWMPRPSRAWSTLAWNPVITPRSTRDRVRW